MASDTSINMDRAALEAGQSLKGLDQEHVDTIAKWWNEWFRKAGHKRLGRMLARVAVDGIEVVDVPGVIERG